MSLIYQSKDQLVNGKRPGIYLGGKTDAKDKDRLRARNVTHVLNVTPAKEACVQAGVPNYFEKEFKYKRVPVYDASTSVPDLLEAADSNNSFIASALCHGSVLVHCQRGASRRIGMSLDDTMSLIERRRPEADPIPDFRVMLEKYEADCKAQGYINNKPGDVGDPAKKKRAAAGPSLPPQQDSPTKRPRTGTVVGRVVEVGPARQFSAHHSNLSSGDEEADKGREDNAAVGSSSDD